MTTASPSKKRPRPRTVGQELRKALVQVAKAAAQAPVRTETDRNALHARVKLLDSLAGALATVCPVDGPDGLAETDGGVVDFEPQEYEDADHGLDYEHEHEHDRPEGRRKSRVAKAPVGFKLTPS